MFFFSSVPLTNIFCLKIKGLMLVIWKKVFNPKDCLRLNFGSKINNSKILQSIRTEFKVSDFIRCTC